MPESKSGALTNLATAHHLKDKIIHRFHKKTRDFDAIIKTVSFLYQNSNKTTIVFTLMLCLPLNIVDALTAASHYC